MDTVKTWEIADNHNRLELLHYFNDTPRGFELFYLYANGFCFLWIL